MAAEEPSNPSNLTTLFHINVPDILEQIFLSLDYKSYKCCLKVNSEWRKLLTSGRYITKAKSVFKEGIFKDEVRLRQAAKTDDKDEVRRLLSSGMVDVNCIEQFDLPPLHIAALKGHKEMAQILIQSGADPNLVDSSRVSQCDTPLLMAVYKRKKEMAKLLIESGADVNMYNELGYTPLHGAAEKGQKEIVKLLIENGADVNAAKYKMGITPLHKAAEEGKEEVAKLLINGGADPIAADMFGRTPLHNASLGGYKGVAQLLIKHGADIDMADEDGRTPLHYAALCRHSEIFLLLRHMTNNAGNSAPE